MRDIDQGGRALRPYQIMPHTGDLALLLRGRNLEELLENGARGLFSIITDRRRVRKALKEELEIRAHSPEGLLVGWMGELLFLFDARGVLFRTFEVTCPKEGIMRGTAWGEPYDEQRHPIKTGIKAVTYHQLKIRKEKDTLCAFVVLDI